MKKFIIASVAALIAATSFASTASSEVVFKYKDGARHHNRAVVVVQPRARVVVRPRARVVIAPRVVYPDACFTKKVKRVNDWGEVTIRRVRVCR